MIFFQVNYAISLTINGMENAARGNREKKQDFNKAKALPPNANPRKDTAFGNPNAPPWKPTPKNSPRPRGSKTRYSVDSPYGFTSAGTTSEDGRIDNSFDPRPRQSEVLSSGRLEDGSIPLTGSSAKQWNHPQYTTNIRDSNSRVSGRSRLHHDDSSSILRIPRKIRIKIWDLLELQEHLELRHACRTLKTDIDEFVGIRAELDETDESFSSLIKLGIRRAIIVNMESPHAEFPRYPNLLRELWIVGNIRSLTFAKLIKDCVNITLLSIQFTKELFAAKPKLFPIVPDRLMQKILPRIRCLKIQSLTKNDVDLKYVTTTFTELCSSHLMNEAQLYDISVSIVHRFSHDLIYVCSQTMSALVCENSKYLEDLLMEIKFQHGPNAQVEEYPGSGNEYSDPSSTGYYSHYFIKETCDEPQHPDWEEFTNLKNLHFSSNSTEFSCYWENIMSFIKSLQTLFCEIPCPTSWALYKKFIEGCEGTLESVTLECVDYHGSLNDPLDIDLTVFQQCKLLENLCMTQTVHPSLKISRLSNVSRLPRSLKVVELAWFSLSTTQAFRLFRFSRMVQLRLAYWSTTDSSFGKFLWLLNWGYTFGCANVKELSLVDLKIRFQNNKKRTNALLQHKKVRGTYVDYNETQLTLMKYW